MRNAEKIIDDLCNAMKEFTKYEQDIRQEIAILQIALENHRQLAINTFKRLDKTQHADQLELLQTEIKLYTRLLKFISYVEMTIKK